MLFPPAAGMALFCCGEKTVLPRLVCVRFFFLFFLFLDVVAVLVSSGCLVLVSGMMRSGNGEPTVYSASDSIVGMLLELRPRPDFGSKIIFLINFHSCSRIG